MPTAPRTVKAAGKTRVRAPESQLIEFLTRYEKRVADLYLSLLTIVLEESPSASEIVFDAGYTVSDIFTLTGRIKESFCYVAAATNHVNLGFNRGAELRDPHGLLKGTGTQMRHIQIKSTADLELPLREYIQLAIDRSLMMPQPVLNKPTVVVKVAIKGGKRRAKR